MQAIILAAGESSRFWPLNRQHKSQIKILGRPLIYWTIKGLEEKGIKDIVIVISPSSFLKEELAGSDLTSNISYTIQEKPLGTGNAVFQAKDLIKEPFFIIWPYKIDSKELVTQILEKYEKDNLEAVLVGNQTGKPWEYGILRIERDKVLEIVENPKPGEEPSQIKLSGNYLLGPDFFSYYQNLTNHHEEDLIDALNIYIKDKKTGFILLDKKISSLKYPWDVLELVKVQMESKYFKNYISPSASVGKNVVISGQVYISDNVVIGDNSIITGPCYFGSNAKIGVNNIFRGPVNIEKDVITGAFTEIKNSLIQEGTHIHSGYFGDSVIGKDCRFGAGFITANRRIDRSNIITVVKGKEVDTGLSYFGNIIGDNTRSGINSGTMPGVLIGSNCLIGPGTIVFQNLEDNMTYYTEFKGIKKERKDGFSDSSKIK